MSDPGITGQVMGLLVSPCLDSRDSHLLKSASVCLSRHKIKSSQKILSRTLVPFGLKATMLAGMALNALRKSTTFY